MRALADTSRARTGESDVNSDATTDDKQLITLNERNLARVIGWISLVDSKAKFIFSIILVVLGYSVPQVASLTKTFTSLWEKKACAPAAVLVLLLLGTFICLIISFVYLVFIIYPKRRPFTGKVSYFYYESIAEMPASQFQAKMSSISATEAIDGLSDQTYSNAKVVKKKFDQLSISVIWFLIGLSFLIVFAISHQIIAKFYLT